MGLELGLFRPPAFVDEHLVNNSNKSNPWANLRDVSEEDQREALNRERTWLMVFVIDRKYVLSLFRIDGGVELTILR